MADAIDAVGTIHSPLSGDDLSFFSTETSIGHSTAQPLPMVTAVIETPSVMKTPAALPTAASASASATDFTATFPPSVSSAMSLALMSSASTVFDTRLSLNGWLEMQHMIACIGMFGVLNRDTLWILPYHCDSIILNPTNSSGWSRFFMFWYVSNHNFNYVVAFVNENGGIVNRYSRYYDSNALDCFGWQ
jgi:hypothetical protein